jgi:filamentous hemagglutinin
VASLSAGALAATLGGAAGGAAGAATAFNVDMNNRQLHPDERRKAGELAKKSGGKYTQEEIENALRNAGNTDKGESIVAGMVVDPKARNAIYDKGAVWTMGENGQLVQVLPSQPPADLVAYIKANTGDTYSWYAPDASATANANAPRDRLTNLPLDDKGRYGRTVVLDGKAYEPKFHSCATAECVAGGKNLDMSDPGTKAYVRALDPQIFKDIGTGATIGTLVGPSGIPVTIFAVTGAGAAVGETALSKDPGTTGFDKGIEMLSEVGAQTLLEKVLGYTPAAAARAAALINLAGGWEAFRERVKSNLLGIKSDEKK